MFLFGAFERLLIVAFLCCTMLSIGLQSSIGEIRALLSSRGFVARVLLANFVLMPLVGIGLIRFVPLTHAGAGALLLLACVPGGASMIKYTSMVKGEASRSGATFILLCIVAMVVSPWILRLVLPSNVDFSVPYDRALVFIAALILFPVGLGLYLSHRWPEAASRWPRILSILGTVSFIAFMAVTKVFRKEFLRSVDAPALACMLALLVAGMAIGWLLGGPTPESRRILATSTSMRNAALCLAIADSSPLGQPLIAPLIGYTILMVPPNLLFTIYHTVRAKRIARQAATA